MLRSANVYFCAYDMSDYGSETLTLTPKAQKDPSDVKDFDLNWAVELDGETISTSTWTTDGLTNEASSYSGTTTTITLSGGSNGTIYDVRNTITTSGGQTFRKSMAVWVREL